MNSAWGYMDCSDWSRDRMPGDTMTIEFGGQRLADVDARHFGEDGTSGSGRWQWPEGDGKPGGYEFTMTGIR